jgi:hypothetical protein
MSLTKKTPKNRSSANNSHGAADAAADAGAVDADARLELVDAAAVAADARLELVDAVAEAVEVAEAAEVVVTADVIAMIRFTLAAGLKCCRGCGRRDFA